MNGKKATVDDVKLLLKQYQKKTEEKISEQLEQFGKSGPLREACEYALLNGGKRFRPALVFMVAEALKTKADVSDAALSIEYFHTASLIADDLPCMDNDDERRNKPSLHKVFGEATALLASYALIAEGNRSIATCAMTLAAQRHDAHAVGVLALHNAASNTGAYGTTGGQFLDMYPPNLTVETVKEVIIKKTVSLFEISFVFGWLFGGGDPTKLPQVQKTAEHFGLAFQIADDLGDIKQDEKNGRKINMAAVCGVDRAKEMFHEEIKSYRALIKELSLDSYELQSLADCLEEQLYFS